MHVNNFGGFLSLFVSVFQRQVLLYTSVHFCCPRWRRRMRHITKEVERASSLLLSVSDIPKKTHLLSSLTVLGLKLATGVESNRHS